MELELKLGLIVVLISLSLIHLVILAPYTLQSLDVLGLVGLWCLRSRQLQVLRALMA